MEFVVQCRKDAAGILQNLLDHVCRVRFHLRTVGFALRFAVRLSSAKLADTGEFPLVGGAMFVHILLLSKVCEGQVEG